jgi:hypothetical protein
MVILRATLILEGHGMMWTVGTFISGEQSVQYCEPLNIKYGYNLTI